jgi:hypothetical protein
VLKKKLPDERWGWAAIHLCNLYFKLGQEMKGYALLQRIVKEFYDYNFAQGTLVPHRTVLYEGDKVIEESEIGTITFGQKVDDGLFPEG